MRKTIFLLVIIIIISTSIVGAQNKNDDLPLNQYISGRIIDNETGKAITSAEISLLTKKDFNENKHLDDIFEKDFVIRRSKTNDDGRYELGSLELKEYYLVIDADGYHRLSKLLRNADSAINYPIIEDESLTPAYIRGRITDGETGEALENAKVGLISKKDYNENKYLDNLLAEDFVFRYTETNKYGKYKLKDVELDEHYLVINAAGYHRTSQLLRNSDNVLNYPITEDKSLTPAYIRGRITDGETGEALENAKVGLISTKYYHENKHLDNLIEKDFMFRVSKTDKDGKYNLEKVNLQEYFLVIEAEGYQRLDKLLRNSDKVINYPLTVDEGLESL
jgi:protocatechuate 3,4-dioxygenase beta subunit